MLRDSTRKWEVWCGVRASNQPTETTFFIGTVQSKDNSSFYPELCSNGTAALGLICFGLGDAGTMALGGMSVTLGSCTSYIVCRLMTHLYLRRYYIVF